MTENTEVPWSSGLIRSYSEDTAVLLQHFNQTRKYSESVQYTRTNVDFISKNQRLADLNPIRQDEKCVHNYSSCMLSGSSPRARKQDYYQHDLWQVGCGDSSELISQFSELSLDPATRNNLNESVWYDCQSMPCSRKNLETFNENTQDLSNNESSCELSEEQRSSQAEDQESPDSVRASISPSSRRTTSRPSITRFISFENWARKKQRELQRRRSEAEMKKAAEEEKEKQQQEKKIISEYKLYDLLKRKKREKLLRRQFIEKELALERQLREIERKAQLAKSVSLLHWRKNKEKQMKASEKEQLMKEQQAKEEKERRIKESLKAYEIWRQKAKNAPRPATQGLLPHQKAKPAFTNPTPWKSLLDNGSDDSDATTQTKPISRAPKNPRSKRTCIRR